MESLTFPGSGLIKNVALIPGKNLATHQLSSSPNLVDGELQKTRESCACAGVGLSVHHVGLGRSAGLDLDFVTKLALKPLPDPPLPAKMQVSTGPASPLQMQYQLNMPGRGEIFPALAAAHAADYWPVAVLSIANTSDKAVLQIISSEVRGWSAELRQTAVIGPHEVRTFSLDPELLPSPMRMARSIPPRWWWKFKTL